MNLYEEVCKILYPDGFSVPANHGVWKLKAPLSDKDWAKVRDCFKFYRKNDLKNSKYGGWMTTEPVSVMLRLKEENFDNQQKLEVHYER